MLRNWRSASAVLALTLSMGAGAAAQAKKTANFTVTAVQSGTGVQVTVTSKVWVTSTKARADVTHPLKGEVRFIVADGYFYQLDPKSKTGVKGPLPPELAKNKDNFQFLLSQLVFDASDVLKVAKKVRTETVSGFKCDVYTKSASKGGANRSITVWMPQNLSPKFPIKAVKTDNVKKPGASVSQTDTITLSKVVVNKDIPASLFSVTGYKLVEGKPQAPKPGK